MGARVLFNVTEQLAVLSGIFDGDQAGPGLDDPQLRNRYGVNFRVNDPPLLLGQASVRLEQQEGRSQPCRAIQVGGLAALWSLSRSAVRIKRGVIGCALEQRHPSAAGRGHRRLGSLRAANLSDAKYRRSRHGDIW